MCLWLTQSTVLERAGASGDLTLVISVDPDAIPCKHARIRHTKRVSFFIYVVDLLRKYRSLWWSLLAIGTPTAVTQS